MPIENFIPLMSPDIRQADIDAVVSVLKSGMLVQGKEVEKLEHAISEYTGKKYAVAVSNGTATLHLSLLAMGIGPGDEVIVPALSYIATANVVELVGAKPVFVDIDLHSFNLDISQIEKRITTRTKAIMPVHEFGLAADMKVLMGLSRKYEIPVIEDSACALGATDQGQYSGTFGAVGSFSFHPRKAITSGEGGMLVTDDLSLAEKLRVMRNHGIEIENGQMEFVMPGFNYRMTDFQAALVHSQLKRLPEILTRRREMAERYNKLIVNPKIKKPHVPEGKEHSWQTYHIILDPSLNRSEVMAFLKDKKIGTNYGAQCMPAQQFYQKKYQLNCSELFPNALLAYEQGLALPLYEKLNMNQIEYVAQIINQI